MIDKNKYLFIYSANASNYFVIHEIEKEFGKVAKIEETISNLDTIRRTIRRRKDDFLSKTDKLFFYLFYYIFLKNKIEFHLSSYLGNPIALNPDLSVKNINDPEAISLAKAIAPNAIFLLGTNILKKDWLSIGAKIINIHTGVLPEYRGRFCWFWPIVNQEYDKIGVTLHLITENVDYGPILIKRILEPKELGDLRFEGILPKLPILYLECLCKVINKELWLNNRNKFIEPKSMGNRIYLEPGITDYVKYIQSLRIYRSLK